VKMSGYSTRKDLSTGVHDHLYVRAVAFENNGKRIVFVSTDLIGLSSILESLRVEIDSKYNIKPDELFLSAIHTHSAPTPTLNEERGHPNNIEYTKALKEKIVAAVGDALNNLTEVQVGVGVGFSPVGSNRREMMKDGSIWLGRNPNGVTDKEVLVMKIVKPDNNPIGALFDYATHATSLGPGNYLISSDVLGLSAQFVEKILGNGVVAPVFAGASGNIDPWYRILPSFNTKNGWIPEPVLLGTMLGEEVMHVYQDIEEVHPGGEIKTAFATLQCPRKKPSDADKARPNFRRRGTGPVPVNITAARIGDVAFVGVSVEMCTEIGMAIKAGSPCKYTFIITHCNGGSGYLAPDNLYKEGGYEIARTAFEMGSADMVIKKALRMLYDL
ncbi:neutral/alkaline non-lysosomal ceramidase N-terminal domain-containing protein, partial [candidate division KSB1 bacterium]